MGLLLEIYRAGTGEYGKLNNQYLCKMQIWKNIIGRPS
jgi:hypothetical protein